MKLYFIATDQGSYRFLFATDEERADQMFALWLIITEAPPSKYWMREIKPDAAVAHHKDALVEALARGVEGFGVYQTHKRWIIRSLEEEFDSG